ncbi:Hsp20/alpha crystallin family protein [Natronomonas salina]|uniref:Hsp20/alpha crystallin family protein n=1 Tax=Natronomonas salina TaxID=1710540 RepID=UPI0015B42C28|nr:Hsp20/alpha crystallin family protein [Natronomonas salina]QLD90038.1 Hsp20/alpha crystallin family protein [Natronomonas salina]
MIRKVGESIGRVVLDGIGRAASRVQERKPLPADLLESDDAFLAVFDAPGTTAGDVQVRFEGHTLMVNVDRFREFHDGYEMRFPGRGLTLDGEVTLPEDVDVDPEAADATIRDNGTLEVLIPKAGDGAAAPEAAEEEETTTGTTGNDPEEASPT